MEETKTSEPVQTEKKVNVSIEAAVSGKRERGWIIQNKCRQIAELKDQEKVPVISLFTVDPTEVPEEAWEMLKTPDGRQLLCCQKTILLLSEVVMQPEMDASDQVVLRMHVLAPKDEHSNKDLFWKTTWGRYMHLGGISWSDLSKETKGNYTKVDPSLKLKKSIIVEKESSSNASEAITD
jgi:hypothetical protein